jgi:regulator of sirC expression with transglutaminase-like and TPR domain
VDPTSEFLALVGRPEAEVALDRVATLVAAHASPGLDVDATLQRLDDLAAGCADATPAALRHHLFATVGFTGDRQHYDDPRNSMIDQVLDRRMGIPITLSVVMLEVGRRLGIRLVGVGMPGHFLVGEGDDRFVDPFERGRLLDREGCRGQFHAVVGPDAPWDPSFLRPVGPHAIMTRILSNLRQAYSAAGDLRSLAWVLRLRCGVPGVDSRERLELVGVLSCLGRYDEAAAELERLAAAGAEDERDNLRGRALRLRARLN